MVICKQQQQLPIDRDGVCMLCEERPDESQKLNCVTCATPWHVACLSAIPENLASDFSFECPDCTGVGLAGAPAPSPASSGELITKIRAIEADASLTELQKAKKKQKLLSGIAQDDDEEEEEGKRREGKEEMTDVLAVLTDSFMCAFCRQLPERPVTV